MTLNGIISVLDECYIVPKLYSKTKEDVIREMVATIVHGMHGKPDYKEHGLAEDIEQALYEEFMKRESKGSSGITDGVAIPHVRSKNKLITKIYLAIGKSNEGIDYNALDNKPVKLFFFLLSPEKNPSEILQIIADAAVVGRDSDARKKLLQFDSNQEIYDFLINYKR